MYTARQALQPFPKAILPNRKHERQKHTSAVQNRATRAHKVSSRTKPQEHKSSGKKPNA